MGSFRVRFAPSPTGPLHIGGVRTALYNYLLAKKLNGTFILRIEDTDQKRYKAGAERHILESLKWFGIAPMEGPIFGGEYGPYRQSERKDLYTKYAMQMISSGHAYYAFDTPEELEQMRRNEMERGVHTPKYDSKVRSFMRNSQTLSKEKVETLIKSGEPYTIRLKVPSEEIVEFHDEIRGQVSFNSNELDDKILIKADGLPTYHMANIVDDHLMKISHVIRGEEWLSSTAHHVLLYKALGWEETMPIFAHLPLILKPTGKGKLSKRDGAKFGFPVFPIEWEDDEESYLGFRESGYLPAAVLNFLAFLGWNPGTEQEIFSIDNLIVAFQMEQISKSSARFDIDKAKWYNQQYIINSENEELALLVKPLLEKNGIRRELPFIQSFCGLMKERVETINEFVTNGGFVFETPETYDEKIIRKRFKQENVVHFNQIKNILKDSENFDFETIERNVKAYIHDKELRFGEIMPVLRVALTGKMQGPDLFQTMELLGKKDVIERLDNGFNYFEKIISE